MKATGIPDQRRPFAQEIHYNLLRFGILHWNSPTLNRRKYLFLFGPL